jgi:hypothetical protein
MTLFFVQYFIPCKRLYMFRVKHSPIFRSSNKLQLQHLVVTVCDLPSSWVGTTHPRRRKVIDCFPLPDAVTKVYSTS